MGGRFASLIAGSPGHRAGLPRLHIHPIGKPDKLRTEHLQSIETPTLIVQGERDPFGNIDEATNYTLSPNVQIHWLADGDHSFKPRKASGRSLDENLVEAIGAVADFTGSL